MKKYRINFFIKEYGHIHSVEVYAKTSSFAILIGLASFISNENITEITSEEI
jgi:hypothetical protein